MYLVVKDSFFSEIKEQDKEMLTITTSIKHFKRA